MNVARPTQSLGSEEPNFMLFLLIPVTEWSSTHLAPPFYKMMTLLISHGNITRENEGRILLEIHADAYDSEDEFHLFL